MPLYEYQCAQCNKTHEVVQKFSDPPLKECPECGGPVEKLVSLSSFALKGSGWYTTDYKKSSAPVSEAKPAEAKPAESKPAESKPAEAKPAEAKPAEAKPADKKSTDNKS